MNFYPFHIGDYMLRTTHLEPLEDLAYRRLIDLYYLNEKPLQGTAEVIARVIRMKASAKEVDDVLQEFFMETPEGWAHKHCESVIAQYRAKAKQAAENGKRGGRPKGQQQHDDGLIQQAGSKPEDNPEITQPVISGLQEETGSKTNHEPITIIKEDQEQKALGASADAPSVYSPEFELFWSEYPKRAGQNSKKSASKKFTARLREGVKADDLILAARRYADQMRATAKYGTEFVKQADTFLGPNEHWREALSSNVHPFKGARSEMKPGDFEYFDPETGKTRICNEATHDRDTGVSLKWMARMGLKP